MGYTGFVFMSVICCLCVHQLQHCAHAPLRRPPRFWPKCISHWSRGNTGTHPWPALMGSDPTRGRLCGHTGSTRRATGTFPLWPVKSNPGSANGHWYVCVCVCVCVWAAPEYVPCIFIRSLTGALPWQTTWAAQILSALAWAQVALASDYNRMVIMRALHKAVHRVCGASPWGAENTMRTVYAIV